MTQHERLEQEWLILLQEDDWAGAVRRRLKELERTQEELARAIDVPLNRIHRHLNGKGTPDVDEAKAVAKAMANWSKARYLSPHRLADLIRPRFSPQWQDMTVGHMALVPAS